MLLFMLIASVLSAKAKLVLTGRFYDLAIVEGVQKQHMCKIAYQMGCLEIRRESFLSQDKN